MKICRFTLALSVLCAGPPGVAQATTIHPILLPFAATAHATGVDTPIAYSAGTVANAGASAYPDGRTASGQSYAGPGGIGFAGTAFVPARDPEADFDGVLGAEAMSGGGGGQLRFDDLVFSSIAGDGAVQAVVSTIFHLSGWMSFDRVIGANSSGRASVSVRYALDTPGLPRNIGSIQRDSDRGGLLFRNDGAFATLGGDASLTVSGTFMTPAQVVPLDTPLLFRMEVGGGATAVARDETPVAAALDFMGTFRLGPDGPIFALPEGITANSAKAGIVNNRFAPLPRADPVTPVPLPPTLVLLASALAVARLARRGKPL